MIRAPGTGSRTPSPAEDTKASSPTSFREQIPSRWGPASGGGGSARSPSHRRTGRRPRGEKHRGGGSRTHEQRVQSPRRAPAHTPLPIIPRAPYLAGPCRIGRLSCSTTPTPPQAGNVPPQPHLRFRRGPLCCIILRCGVWSVTSTIARRRTLWKKRCTRTRLRGAQR